MIKILIKPNIFVHLLHYGHTNFQIKEKHKNVIDLMGVFIIECILKDQNIPPEIILMLSSMLTIEMVKKKS